MTGFGLATGIGATAAGAARGTGVVGLGAEAGAEGVFDLEAEGSGTGAESSCVSVVNFFGFLGLRAKVLSKITLLLAKSMPLTT